MYVCMYEGSEHPSGDGRDRFLLYFPSAYEIASRHIFSIKACKHVQDEVQDSQNETQHGQDEAQDCQEYTQDRQHETQDVQDEVQNSINQFEKKKMQQVRR